MKERVLTGFLFIVVVALLVLPSFWTCWPTVVFFVAVSAIACLELEKALAACRLQASRLWLLGGSLLPVLPLFFARLQTGLPAWAQLVLSLALTGLVLAFYCCSALLARLLKDGPQAFPQALATAASLLYVAWPTSCGVLMLAHLDQAAVWLVIGLSAPWISDVFAYFVGSTLGRRPIVPRLSPNKTLEGSLGGLLGSMASQVLVFWLFQDRLGLDRFAFPRILPFALLVGLVLSLFSQLGDWFASAFKRFCAVKDFGTILPGHGGLLDRFDSAFFTLPVTLVLALVHQLLV